jgi:hypothetical protein
MADRSPYTGKGRKVRNGGPLDAPQGESGGGPSPEGRGMGRKVRNANLWDRSAGGNVGGWFLG